MTIADGSVAAMDNTGMATQQTALAAAYDAVYERRRIAWIKMRFIPRYTDFVQAVGVTSGGTIQAQPPTFQNIPVFVVHDANGLNGSVHALDANAVTSLLANTTGVKIKKLNRAFKVFRRSRKIPYAPKYLTPNTVAGQPTGIGEIYPSGLWLNTTSNNAITDNSREHTWVVSEPLPSATTAGLPVYTCVYEIKYQWADKRSAYQ